MVGLMGICHNRQCKYFDIDDENNCSMCLPRHIKECWDVILTKINYDSEGPVYEYIEVGEWEKDDQLGNYYNALDDLSKYFFEERNTSKKGMSQMLQIYAEGLKE